jgi:hypothetical protein
MSDRPKETSQKKTRSPLLTALGAIGLILLGWMLPRIQVRIEPVSPPSNLNPLVEPLPPPPVVTQKEVVAIADAAPLPEGFRQGKMRVSNLSIHPVRVVILPQKSDTLTVGVPDGKSPYSQPFHWDFAPGEGGQKGLPLALPTGELALNSGDVVTVFAQDGSQRYWGPYVLDRVSQPQWNDPEQGWLLQVK